MKQDKEKTKVIFRILEGQVIALFPEHPGTNERHTCDSYMHVGQHSAADYAGIIGRTRAALPVEYAALRRELESIGYNLVIKKRESVTMRWTRYKALGV